MSHELLTRDQFREGVFDRDKHTCVVCGRPAVDAHHIIERRLWPDGGYYLDNGASVCGECHLECERTRISVEDIRWAAGIIKPIIPPHMYSDVVYDKWANIILPTGQRLKGELFFDESVQKVLKEGGVFGEFAQYVKYPRTHHLPWSPGMHDDDRMMQDTNVFKGRRVIVTEKMDGENTTMYNDHIHARSVDSANHVSRNWVKNFWSQIAYEIPEGWRICGENLYAEHSIPYELPTYFTGFSIWNERNRCLNWDETQEWFLLLGITTVPVLYDDVYNEADIRALWEHTLDPSRNEGYVVRLADSFPLGSFQFCVGKFVRKGHIMTTKHWMHGQPVKPNKLLK